MRKIAITTLLTLLALNAKAATGENKITRQLTNDMYCFFTQTLKSTYDINNEEKLYSKFLSDYFKSRMDSKNKVNQKTNRHRLSKINKRLFIRDYEHYYYFFPELKYARSKQSVEPLKSSCIKNNPAVPLVFRTTIASKKNSSTKDYSFYTSHVMILNTGKNTFYDAIKEDSSLSARGIVWNMENFHELSFLNFSRMFVIGEAGKELKSKKIREMVAVIFWKYLCLNENIPFHRKS